MKTIIKRPIITEKTLDKAKDSLYVFEVALDARKNEIAGEVAKAFNVHVVSVRTSIMHGKTRVAGKKRRPVLASNKKKAYVQLKKGERIELFEVAGN